MILQSLDRIVQAECPGAHVALTLANVTDTARALERNHLCGPIAGLVLADFVGGAALLGTLLEAPGQTVVLRARLPGGALGGALLECAYGYAIRGYTFRKVLPDLDDSEAPDETLFDRAIGRSAHCSLVRSWPGGRHEESVFEVAFPDRLTVTDIVEQCFCESLGRTALVQLAAASKVGYVECAHALLCEFSPEASDATYDRVGGRFDDGSVQDLLDSGADLGALAAHLGLGAPTILRTSPVRFACGCDAQKVLRMLRALPLAERQAMAAEGKAVDIFCHMCGKCYTLTPQQLRGLL